MKIQLIEEKEYENLILEIKICIDEKNMKIISDFKWTCPKCRGYGCGRHGSGGSCEDRKSMNSFSDIQKMLGEKESQKLKEKIMSFLQGNDEL